MTGPVTKETPIGDIVRDFPIAVGALMEIGLHCFGCHSSSFETIGDGLRGHGMSEEEVDETIESLNKLITDAEKQ